MKYKIRFLPKFDMDVADLADILSPYPSKARRLFAEMERKIAALADNPHAHEVYHVNPKYRRIVLEGHSLFYTVDEDRAEVSIYRVIYAKRDIAKLLND
jgi:plasmid stabilization system protein ParE